MPTQAELIKGMKERVFQVKEKIDPGIAELNDLVTALAALTGESRDTLISSLQLSVLRGQVADASQVKEYQQRRRLVHYPRARKSPVRHPVWSMRILEALKGGPLSQKGISKALNSNTGTISVVVRELIDEGLIKIVGLEGRSRVLALAEHPAQEMKETPAPAPPKEKQKPAQAKSTAAREYQPQRTGAAVKEMIRTFLAEHPTEEFTNKQIASAVGLRERQVYHKLVDMRNSNELLTRKGEKPVGGLGIPPNLYRVNPSWTTTNQ